MFVLRNLSHRHALCRSNKRFELADRADPPGPDGKPSGRFRLAGRTGRELRIVVEPASDIQRQAYAHTKELTRTPHAGKRTEANTHHF